MSSTHHNHDDIEKPKDFEVSQGFYMLSGGLFAIGALAFLAGLFGLGDPRRAWNAYLMGWWFTLALGLAGPFINATQYVATGGWGVSIRRVTESFGVYLIPATIFGIILLAGAPEVMPWMGMEDQQMAGHVRHIIHLKFGFLNMTGLTITTIAAPLVLLVISWIIRRNSLKQDETGDVGLTESNKLLSVFYLLAFGVGFSLLSWYWLMSLEPAWYATMWNVYAFAALFQSGLAATTIGVLLLKKKGVFGDFVNDHQIHSLGQLVFAFTVFYAYISFSMFMLCWYANIPEESLWYIRRLGGLTPADEPGGYSWFIILWVFKFIVPFLVLLPQEIKKNKNNLLYYVCWGIMAIQAYEVWYWVAFAPTNPDFSTDPILYLPWLEILVVLGFVGAFLAVVGRSLSSHNIIPTKDPFLHETLPHGHHHDEEEGDESLQQT
jgi:hypothetical protein